MGWSSAAVLPGRNQDINDAHDSHVRASLDIHQMSTA